MHEPKRWAVLVRAAAVSAVLFGAAAAPVDSQGWERKTFGRLSCELPTEWKNASWEDIGQQIWMKGDPENPEVIFSVIRTADIQEIFEDFKVEAKTVVVVGGKKAVKYTGSPVDEAGKGLIIVFDEKEGGETLALIGAFQDESVWNREKSVFDRIVGSVRFAGAAAAPACVWDSFTFDQRQFAAQPGGVFPMRRNFPTGSYRIHVGPAGKTGLDIPPKAWRTFGPYPVVAGRKYAAIIKRGAGTICELDWETDSARIMMYSVPPADKPGLPGHAVVYVRNDIPDEFYAICLEPVGAPAGGKPELQFDDSWMRSVKAGATLTLRAKAVHIPAEVKRLKFSWYLHLNDCLSATPPGTKVNFWYNQFADVVNGEAECTLVMKAASAPGESSFTLLVQDEPYQKRVFLSTKTLPYKIQ
ncbi:MAG: hypothetical protein FJY82_14320 [Candidatus Aminicenantes bacterium]|nr:hypothetical protein [Candidatus Aminicenantes bacterium]